MKLHRNVAQEVVDGLAAVFERRQVAERVVAATLQRQPKWGARDRSLFAELFYDIVRWRRWLANAVPCDESDAWSLLAAEVSRLQVATHTIPELEHYDGAALRERLMHAEVPRAISQSIPDWLDELGARELGGRWDDEIVALNTPAPVVLRANTLRITRDELYAQLQADEIYSSPLQELPDALQLSERPSLKRYLSSGHFEVQDAASQLVAPLLRAEPGQTVVDACAGAGGKTLHLGALMCNQGRIVVFDVDGRRLEELERRAARAGVTIAVPHLAPKSNHEWLESADRLLIDAPCSGLGTLRRQPDLKWRLSTEFLAELAEKQRQILEFYAPMLKSGGLIVYATCSVLPSENERQVEWFLSRHADFELTEQRAISCAETGFDGFFMALLRRN